MKSYTSLDESMFSQVSARLESFQYFFCSLRFFIVGKREVRVRDPRAGGRAAVWRSYPLRSIGLERRYPPRPTHSLAAIHRRLTCPTFILLDCVSINESISMYRSVAKSPQGRLITDPQLRVVAAECPGATQELLDGGRVFAVGDCAVSAVKPLPALAQVTFTSSITCSIPIFLQLLY